MSLNADPRTPPPMWPFVLGFAAVIGALSWVSLRGQREIHARVARQYAERERRRR